MAVPPSVTMKDVTGSYYMSKTLSDDLDKYMALQGVGWALRKTMSLVPVTMNVKHTPPTIEINLAPGGGPFKGTTEVSIMGGEAVQRSNPMLGTFMEKMKETKVVDIEDEWLKEGWVEDSVIEIWEDNEKGGWENHGCFGFMEVQGKKHYCRKSRVKNKKVGEGACRIVYEYKPLSK